MFKLFVMVPKQHTDRLIDAMASAGAGIIGNYSHNAVITPVIGTWKSEAGSHPIVGNIGTVSREPEDKVEMVCPNDRLNEVVLAIRSTHPYEEPAIDIVQLVDIP